MSNTTRSKYGSKQRLARNKWRLFVSAGRKSDGKRRRMSKVFEGTESEADAELMRFAYECGNTAMIGESMTLRDYFWLCFSPERHKTTTRANAINYDSIYKCHIDAPLGRLRLCELDYATIKRWVLSLAPAKRASLCNGSEGDSEPSVLRWCHESRRHARLPIQAAARQG